MPFLRIAVFVVALVLVTVSFVFLQPGQALASPTPGEICKEHALAYKETALLRDQGAKAQDLILHVAMMAQDGAPGGAIAAVLRMIVYVYSNPDLEPQDFYDSAHKECSAHFGLVES